MRVIWSAEARSNLLVIYEYIAQDSPQRAESFVVKLISKTDRLKRFPFSGRIVPELAKESPPPRKIIVGNYRIIYQARADKVEIVPVYHGIKQAGLFD